MKKNINVLLIALIFLLSVTGVSAAETGSWESYGGLSYNSYGLEEANALVNRDEVNDGLSFFIGSKKWTSSNLAVGGEIESMEVDWEELLTEKIILK